MGNDRGVKVREVRKRSWWSDKLFRNCINRAILIRWSSSRNTCKPKIENKWDKAIWGLERKVSSQNSEAERGENKKERRGWRW